MALINTRGIVPLLVNTAGTDRSAEDTAAAVACGISALYLLVFSARERSSPQ
ncbi:MAG: hypothetical protein U1F35_10025 [Steroidobacteraceae bacterium]